jgi:caa(3)-type oxidase subunit IV
MSEHQHPNYKKIYFTLVGLLVISVLGPFVGLVWVTLITAFGIALVKANMVVQNFMHLRWEKGLMKWVLASSLVLMFLFFAGVAPDVMKHTGTGWRNDAAIAATERGIEVHGEDVEHEAEAENVEGAPEPEVAAAPAAFDPAGAFSTVCATCHGTGGQGDGPGAAALDPKPADFTDPAFWAERPDEELITAIREGGAAVGRSPLMPAWGSLYSEEQAAQIVEYLKGFRPGG